MKIKKWDIVLVLVLLIVAGAAFGIREVFTTPGAEAVVTMNGEEIMRLPLDEDCEVLLGEGDHTNLLVIKDGKAAVTEATCPDKVCVHTGKIYESGQTIVCLPHRLVVSIEGGESETDAVVN